ncbi:NADH:ubiquinone reductase (Na(+)-transporting) subunit C [uncultured Porphyromonas sp.]|uniref:NADH:ubiquinone reductase (Na(+)-transporting) subunit C n=1 Tax=uncultured Porphyromonas sp. TaxID=159274 RepID=UPI0005DCA158|nr:NADH:ubiquinone reductase (Na(+)-transporting) subunit C [uncultured Porphyromonas sp.]CQB86820.1 Na(+)-translocating NADH-quinone reductase subunit C [Chlamydia trachomatis]
MNKNSNTYVILYSAIMVILVAVGLAFTSQVLKEKQTENVNKDTMAQILAALKLHPEDVPATYHAVIKEAFLVDKDGQIVPDSEGTDVKDKAFTKDLAEIGDGIAPVFVADVDGATKYILGLHGAGLWGPIWGYIALDDDASTVYGINLSHASETPGLGAEIASYDHFRKHFEGLEIYKDGNFKSIAVVKKSTKVEGQDRVDGISGGTITSHGVNDMLFNSLSIYRPYLDTLRK